MDAKTKKGLPKDATLPWLKKVIAAKHPPLADFLGGAIGYRLMLDESSILVAVLGSLKRRGVVALPIHDAILVPLSAAEISKSVMIEEAERLYDIHIPITSKDLGSLEVLKVAA